MLIWTQGGDEFARSTSQETVVGIDGRFHTSDQASVWRWRDAFQNDFAARMDWTVTDFAHANHNALVVVNGNAGAAPIEMNATKGQTIELDAKGTSDPNGGVLTYHWFVYPEAGLTGSHGADVSLSGEDTPRVSVTAKSACRPLWLRDLAPCRSTGIAHIILAVTNDGSPRLSTYKMIVLSVSPEVSRGTAR